MFTSREREYLQTQRLARLATVGGRDQPTVDAVGIQFDGEQFIVGGHNLPSTRKFRNVSGGHHHVALIIDDLAATEPWTPRGIKVHGTVEIVTRDGFFGPGEYFVITPTVSWSWGILAATFSAQGFAPHKIIWTTRQDAGGHA